MKKLITAALLMSAISLFAEAPLPPQPPCQCIGIGIPKPTDPMLKTNQTPVTAPAPSGNVVQYLLYKTEIAWLYFLSI